MTKRGACFFLPYACSHSFYCCACPQEVHDALSSIESEAERLLAPERGLLDAVSLDACVQLYFDLIL